MKEERFGSLPDGREISAYTMEDGDIKVTILNYGGTIQKLLHKDIDIVGGFDTLEGYLADDSYQGALVGRFSNRIKDGRLTLGGREYKLSINENGKTHLHGGTNGFNRKVWSVRSPAGADNTLELSYQSPDGEEGYPGNLDVKVTYKLSGGRLSIKYEAVCDADTFVSLTNHSYFNLNGIGSGDIFSHEIKINADYYSEVDSNHVATGRRLPVAGGPYDFRARKLIGTDISPDFAGYGDNFILNGKETAELEGRSLQLAADMRCRGRRMRVYTDMPCMQFYTGRGLSGTVPFKGGILQRKHSTVCLEPQFEPDSPRRGESILPAGKKYDCMTVFELSVLPYGKEEI